MFMLFVLSFAIVIMITACVGEGEIVRNITRVYVYDDNETYKLVVNAAEDRRRGKSCMLLSQCFAVKKTLAPRCTLECLLYRLCVKQRRSSERCPVPLNCHC
jgi:hypothetical protein